MTDASHDTFLMELQRDFGHVGYCFWFKTLELIGSQGELGRVRIRWADYLHLLNTKRAVAQQLLSRCRANGKMLSRSCGDTVEIESLKFREFSDFYTKYNGLSTKRLQRQNSVSTKQDVEEDKEKKKMEITPPYPPKGDSDQKPDLKISEKSRSRANHPPRQIGNVITHTFPNLEAE